MPLSDGDSSHQLARKDGPGAFPPTEAVIRMPASDRAVAGLAMDCRSDPQPTPGYDEAFVAKTVFMLLELASTEPSCTSKMLQERRIRRRPG